MHLTRERYGVERLGSLSDAVFAVVLTLLVLDLKIPELTVGFEETRMVEDLLGQGPVLVAWIISFVLIARFWTVHHAVVHSLRECHAGTLMVNFVVLGITSLIPFGSHLIGAYEFDPVAILVFSVLVGLSGLSIGLFSRHVANQPDMHRGDTEVDLLWHWRYNAIGLPLIAVFAIVMGFVHPSIAIAAWIVEPVLALGLALRR